MLSPTIGARKRLPLVFPGDRRPDALWQRPAKELREPWPGRVVFPAGKPWEQPYATPGLNTAGMRFREDILKKEENRR